MAAAYEQSAARPAAEEYRTLRRICGLSETSLEAARRGLPNSLFATVIRQRGDLVAMGRVVGDGGRNFELVDVAVHPDHQRRGLGTRIVRALRDWLDEHAPESAYVSLIADDHSPKLYAKFGFEPTTPRSIGMAYVVGTGGTREE